MKTKKAPLWKFEKNFLGKLKDDFWPLYAFRN